MHPGSAKFVLMHLLFASPESDPTQIIKLEDSQKDEHSKSGKNPQGNPQNL